MTSKTLWTILSALLVASAGLAGCLTDDSSTLSTDEGGEGADTSGNQTFSGGNETASDDSSSEAPSVAIDVTGDSVTVNDTANGTVFEVAVGANITFDASASSDPAGGNLSFAWDLGDGTTAEGANVTYAFGAAGNYTVTVTATSDVSGETASAKASVMAAEAAADDGQLEPLVFEGESLVGNPAHSQICFRDGIDGNSHGFSEDYVGAPWTLSDGYAVYWWNGGSFVGGGDTGSGTIPDGVNLAEICDTSDVGGSYTFAIAAAS